MRIVTGNAILARDRTHRTIPETAGPSVGARLPVAVGRPVTTAAELCAFREFQFATIARLEQLQIIFVVAIVTEIVPVVPAVSHHDFRMLLRDDQVVLVVKGECG